MSRLASLVFSLLAAAVLSAATLQQLSLDQMAQAATAVVRARVSGSYTSTLNATIYTHYKLQVGEVWKGTPAAEVMVPGGVWNGVKQSFPGVPELREGSEYVLFLWKSPSTAVTHLVGLPQGVLNVSRQPDGAMIAGRVKIGEMMLDAAGRKVADQAFHVNLTELKTRVRQPAGTERLPQ